MLKVRQAVQHPSQPNAWMTVKAVRSDGLVECRFGVNGNNAGTFRADELRLYRM